MLKALRSWDTPRVIQLVAPIFVNHEPMSKTLGITTQDFKDTFQDLIAECCDSGLSTAIIIDNEPVSVSLAIAYDKYVTIPVNCKNTPIISPLLNILDEMDHQHPVHQNHESTLYHFIAGTDAKHMNKGYAQRAIKGTIDMARHRGYTRIIADATNIVSQNLLMKSFQYKPMGEICYASFKHGDEHVFRVITPHTNSIIRMVKDLC
jgi:hypothetical protein